MSPRDHVSVRLLLINSKKEILLMKASDPSTRRTDGKYNGDFWFLIGGGVEEGESLEETAQRELFEETGLKQEDYELGPLIWTGDFELILSGTPRRMIQKFMVAHTTKEKISLEHLTDNEKKVVKEVRWFSLDEIQNTEAIIYPVTLPLYLPDVLEGKYPETPFDIDAGRNPGE